MTTCEDFNHRDCSDYYNCCDCGIRETGGCGCRYCWSCNACDECYEERE